jgi:V/A-type H+-transporting ATPase subunit K
MESTSLVRERLYTIKQGGWINMTASKERFRRKLIGFGILNLFFIFMVFGIGAVKAFAQGDPFNEQTAVSQPGSTAKHTNPEVGKFAFLAAAIAVGAGAMGGGIAVGYVGAAAMGTIGEKPELAIRALLFVGLAEGIAIYGLIIAIMILGKV